MKTFQVPELAWYGARLREFELQPDWRVSLSRMAGHDRRALTTDSIAAAIRNPVECEPLRSRFMGIIGSLLTMSAAHRIDPHCE